MGGQKSAIRLGAFRPTDRFILVLLIASWLVLQPGYLGTDERIIFTFVSDFTNHHFNVAAFLGDKSSLYPFAFLNHDFAWFSLQLAIYFPYWLVGHIIPILNNATATQFYMAAMLNLPIWIALYLGWKILRQQGIGEVASALALAGFFAGSYEISILPGSFLAVTEACLVCVQLFLVGRPKAGRMVFLLLGFFGGYLTELRPYNLLCVLVIAYLGLTKAGASLKRNQTIWWLVGMAIALAAAAAARINLPAYPGYATGMEPALGANGFIGVYALRIAGALLSFGYGIFWTAPFLLFALWSRDRRSLAMKFAAIMSIIAVTALYPYWAGESGVAGDRYLAGYLFLLLPEAGSGFQRVLERHRVAALAVPLLVLCFLPCMAYRHNVTVEYAVGQEGDDHLVHPVVGVVSQGAPQNVERHLPIWNPEFQPAFFAWWQAAALLAHRQMVLPLNATVLIDPRIVPPYGLVPRLIYISAINSRSVFDPRIAAARELYQRRLVWMADILFILAALVISAWLALLGTVTSQALRPSG